MANSPQVNIDLIGKPKTSVTQDFLKWTFNIGRIIIATTELIALGALAYRFYIDRQIIDLHDKIRRAQLFVEGQAPKEESYRSIHNRLTNIRLTEENTDIKIGIMNKILQSVALGNFSSSNLTIDLNNIRFTGTAFSVFPINTFIDDLKKNPDVNSISLDDITSTIMGVRFTLTIELREKT